jgi:ABC-type cobalamin/Fe3+-siderophores transport system ATPase subunit
VRAGQRIAIAGRAGAGKSTLLQCIAGLRAVDAGRVHSDFDDVLYCTTPSLPLGGGKSLLYLVDDTATCASADAGHLLAQLPRTAAAVIATRHVAQIAPHVHQVFTLKEGRLEVLPRTPIRRVAERRVLDAVSSIESLNNEFRIG